MPDFGSLPLAELEALCDENMREFYRGFHRDPEERRGALVRYLSKPKLPIEDLLTALRSHDSPKEAWSGVLTICQRSAPAAPWHLLPSPDLERDIAAARRWLSGQLRCLPKATGIYLGLDTLNMRGGRGQNVAFGGNAECDSLEDSQDWLERKLRYGSKHLIRGLYELHSEYSQAAWRVRDSTVAAGDASSFADYTLFLGYSGIILGHAFGRLKMSRTVLPAWGFHDGDMFLLGRKTPDAFTWLCK